MCSFPYSTLEVSHYAQPTLKGRKLISTSWSGEYLMYTWNFSRRKFCFFSFIWSFISVWTHKCFLLFLLWVIIQSHCYWFCCSSCSSFSPLELFQLPSVSFDTRPSFVVLFSFWFAFWIISYFPASQDALGLSCIFPSFCPLVRFTG